jgi:hypothetical protein
MADVLANVAKGRFVEFYNRVKSNDPSTSAFVLVLLETAEADGTLIDYDTLSALLGGSNTEAAFTNYARLVITDSELAALPAPNDTDNWYQVDLPDQVITDAGGAANETLAKAILCYAPDSGGADSTFIPCLILDCVVTTNGEDLNLRWPNDALRAA